MSPSRFLIRLIYVLGIVFLIFAFSKSIVRSLPGNPVDALIAESGTTIPREELAEELGLNRPYWPALRAQLASALHGDLGTSIILRRPIAPLIGERFGRSAELVGLAALMALTLSFSVATLAHLPGRAMKIARAWVQIHSTLSASLPTPWIAPIFASIFAVKLRIFEVSGAVALPAFTLAFVVSGFWIRMLDGILRAEIHAPAAQAARARGLGEIQVLLKYSLAPSAGALIGYLGTQMGGLLAGAFITETVFDWPGIGALLMESVFKRDYPVVEATLFVTATVILLGNWLGDVGQSALNPRLRGDEV